MVFNGGGSSIAAKERKAGGRIPPFDAGMGPKQRLRNRSRHDYQLRQLNLAVLFDSGNHIAMFCDNRFKKAIARAMKSIGMEYDDVDRPLINLSTHFKQDTTLFYKLSTDITYVSAGNNLQGHSIRINKRFKQFIKAFGMAHSKYGIGYEFHLPAHERMDEVGKGAQRLNACRLEDQAMLLLRYIFVTNEFAKKGRIPSGAVVMTEHPGYLRRGQWEQKNGEKELKIHSDFEVVEDAVLNQLIYNMMLGKINEFFRLEDRRPIYKHGFEILQGKTTLSENVADPFDLLITVSAFGSVVPDVAHIMQNEGVRDFRFDMLKFSEHIHGLKKRLDARRDEIEQHLAKVQKYMEEIGFEFKPEKKGMFGMNRQGVPRLTIEDLHGHLNTLWDLGNSKEEAHAGTRGLPELLFYLRAAKRRLGKQEVDEPLIQVAHLNITETTNVNEIKEPAEVLKVYKNDRPYEPGKNPLADSIVKAILDENPCALLVDEGKAGSIDKRLQRIMALRRSMGKCKFSA
ncbi:hypothetical protein DRN67_02935 [Candidatus Micrarchaeota archaeon]|nr:MAG: hypothetical protein DRN67_02935 [Candidatus Micrarchaeota archaeon]